MWSSVDDYYSGLYGSYVEGEEKGRAEGELSKGLEVARNLWQWVFLGLKSCRQLDWQKNNWSNFSRSIRFLPGALPEIRRSTWRIKKISNSRGLKRKQGWLQSQQHFAFSLLRFYTHYIINRQTNNAQRNQKYTFPIKTRAKKHTFPKKRYFTLIKHGFYPINHSFSKGDFQDKS